jgi:hypothetical protein
LAGAFLAGASAFFAGVSAAKERLVSRRRERVSFMDRIVRNAYHPSGRQSEFFLATSIH